VKRILFVDDEQNVLDGLKLLEEVIQSHPEVVGLVSRIHSLPSIPAIYTGRMSALQSPDVSPQEIGSIVRRNLAMTVKVLQLLNSAFSGIVARYQHPGALGLIERLLFWKQLHDQVLSEVPVC
jgi:c-di-GMP-related signal transduction protein